ncbi:MAG: nucleotidyl transferase AbiEii/AbiGii toxin family protein [Candidatus Omnitrophota bacterium]
MLNMEYLLEEAQDNGLPILKKRAIIREYLQIIILNSIYKHKCAKSMFFMGGTALRFFYNIPRFSEDLDFNTNDLALSDFKAMVGDGVNRGLSKEGFYPKIIYKTRKSLFTAELYFKDMMNLYGIVDKRGSDLMVKIEVNRPQWELLTESCVMSLYGYNFSSILMNKSNLISEKLCALFNRKRGRDIYDTLFMLKKKFPFNERVLEANGFKGHPKGLIIEYLHGLSEKELKFLAEQVRPFLFKEEDAELVLKAPLYAERFLEAYE